VLGDSHFLAFTNFFLAAFALKHFFILFTIGEIPYLMNSPMTLKVQSKASKPMKQYTRKHDTALKAVSSSVGEAGLNYWRVYSRRQALRRVLHSKIQAVQQTLRFERKTREMRETSTSPATLTNSRSESCTHGAVMYACANPFRKRPETVMVRAT